MADDLTKAPKEVVIALINRDNTTSFTAAMLDFEIPTVSAGAKNTEVVAKAVVGSGYRGQKLLEYNRLHLTTSIATPAGKDLTFLVGSSTKLSELIPQLNTLLAINLTAEDYDDVDLPEFVGTPNETHPVQAVAKANSLCYLGSLTITIKAEEIDLETVITEGTLNGLTYQPPA